MMVLIRRMGIVAALAGTLAFALPSGFAAAQQQKVVVQIGSGDFAEAMKKAFVEPFEKETGIKVVTVPEFMSPAKLKLMVENKSGEIDIVLMAWLHAISSNESGLLEKIDYSVFDKDELAAVDAVARQPYGVGAYYYSQVIAYNTKKYSADNHPKTWTEFWDVTKFPGTRSFKSGVQGEGGFEEALLADGVAMDKLYPLDIDRAYRSLEKLKPHVKKWWRFGAEGQQIFADSAADLGMIYNGRAENLRAKGAPIAFDWNEGKLLLDFMLIPKGAHNVANAQKFIAFATRAKPQSVLGAMMFYGPTNKNAFKYLDEKTGKSLSTHPNNVNRQFVRNDKWYAEKGPDGRTNLETLIEKWNRFTIN